MVSGDSPLLYRLSQQPARPADSILCNVSRARIHTRYADTLR